jgi:hypothetical protein
MLQGPCQLPMGKAYMRPFAKAKPLNLQPQKFTRLITLVTLTDVQTSILIGWIKAPPRIREIQRLFDFFLLIFFSIFFVFFSRNRVTAERSVAQTCMMAQTTWFGARTCLFGVSLISACIKGSRIPQNPPKFRPLWEFQA